MVVSEIWSLYSDRIFGELSCSIYGEIPKQEHRFYKRKGRVNTKNFNVPMCI